jgi:adenylate cyclase
MIHSMTRPGLEQALTLLRKALALSPDYNHAAILAGGVLAHRVGTGWAEDWAEEQRQAIRLLRGAVDRDASDPDALGYLGRHLSFAGRYEEGIELTRKATRLCPNSGAAWMRCGWAEVYAAEALDALASFERAIRLSPLDPTLYWSFTGQAVALLQLSQDHEAVRAARQSGQMNSRFPFNLRVLAASLAHIGQLDEARATLAEMLAVEPQFTISDWSRRAVWRQSAKERLLAGLRLAGAPE